MENMKRAISAFMALVLVLGMMPGVPMFAGAEEVETQPETVAVETTAAVTVPEETEAPETIAAETEAPETVPETTAAAETVPQETVSEEIAEEETLPQETVAEETVAEETIPEETVEEVSEEAADASDTIVLAQKIEISASKERTYVGDDVKLTAVISPSNVTQTDVSWVVDGGDINLVALEKGYLRANEAGIYTIHAEAIDGSPAISEPITVEFVNYKMEINEAPIPEENIFEGQYILQTGDTLPISVKYMTWAGDESEGDAKVELPLHTPNVKWSMAVVVPGGQGEERSAGDYYVTGEDVTQFISWTESADTKEIQLKAKLVTEYKYILVTAKEMIDDMVLGESSMLIRLYPDSYKIHITETVNEHGDAVQKDVTNGLIALDMAQFQGEEQIRITLNAGIWPIEGNEKLVWATSDSLVELEDPDEEDDWNNEMILLIDKRSGETKVSVQGAEHPGVYAEVTIRRVRYVQGIEPSQASEKVQTDGLGEGKSVKLQAVDSADREIVDNKLLKWELAEGDEEYATISEEGVLKAKDVDMGRVITVKCTVLREDDQTPAGFELYIPIIPKATEVNILAETFLGDSGDLAPEAIVNGMTLTVDSTTYTRAVPAFRVHPYTNDDSGVAGSPVGVAQEVTWKSSNTAVAAFDPITDELIWKGKNGTTTITATAKDGSGKSASVKLQFGTKLQEIWFNDQEGMFLRSGSGWTFDLGFYPEKATDKGVTWSVQVFDKEGNEVPASSVVTLSNNGRLTAKTVYDNYEAFVTVTSKENKSIQATHRVLIRPKNDDFLTLLDENGVCVTKGTIQLDMGQSVSLSAVFVPEEIDMPYEDVVATWKSSNTSVAEVEDGFIMTGEKTGTANITAKFDKQQVNVTVKVVSQVDDVQVYDKKHPDNSDGVLTTGMSMDLKATLIDYDTATEKKPNGTPTVTKVNWVITEGTDFATVNSSGKVTAKKLPWADLPVDVTVTAYATDGSGAYGTYDIKITPAVEKIRIRIDGKAYDTYTYYMAESIEEEIFGEAVATLTAEVTPWMDAWGEPSVTWKSSNTKIADVDENGDVTAYKPGTVTITATSQDGSNKKASLKLVIASKAIRMEWNNNANELVSDSVFAIAGGKNLTLKPLFYGVDGKKINVPVEWEISTLVDSYGTAFVKKFSKGAITTERVTQPKFTEVSIFYPAAYAPDGAELVLKGDKEYAKVTVLVGVYPATTSLQITENGKVVNSSLWRKAGCEPFELGVQTNEYAASGWTWKSSNPKIATVDEFGNVIPTWDEKTESYKAGTVTITATAKDGTGKSDSIKIVFAK